MKNILFVHQSADLYGSDKTLLFLVDSIKDTVNPIVVVPEEGPLTDELKKIDVEVLIIPVLKVSRELFKKINILKFPFQIFKAIYILRKKIGKRKIDIIHSNTLAIFLGAFYGKIYRIKHIWHVHEIILYPKVVAKSYPFLVNLFSDFVVFNSLASAENLYKSKPKLKFKSEIIYNGLNRTTSFLVEEERLVVRKNLFKNIQNDSIIIGLVGRINKHKGQQLLLNVFEKLKKENIENIYLLFIGSPIKSQQFLLEGIKNEIKHKNLENVVTIINFQKEIWNYYDCIDIIIVPTTDPEPFGLVAVEGMLSQKPIIAANHGGLKEIVVHYKTGLLFEPCNESDLKRSIETLIYNKNLLSLFGREGENRAKTEFSLEKYVTNFKNLYTKFL